MEKAQILKRLQKLETELTNLNNLSAESRQAVQLDQQSVGRLSRMDALQQQAMAKATEMRRLRDLERIKHAYKKLESDDYGYCEMCDEAIPDKRLEIDPLAIICTDCAAKRSK